jgi:hypothetical protein
MTSKADETRFIKSEVNRAKSQLIDTLRRLEGIDARTAANQLGAIIGRLEAWQNR